MLVHFRMIVTKVLGELEFNFYHRWFDVIFLVRCNSAGWLLSLVNVPVVNVPVLNSLSSEQSEHT